MRCGVYYDSTRNYGYRTVVKLTAADVKTRVLTVCSNYDKINKEKVTWHPWLDMVFLFWIILHVREGNLNL